MYVIKLDISFQNGGQSTQYINCEALNIEDAKRHSDNLVGNLTECIRKARPGTATYSYKDEVMGKSGFVALRHISQLQVTAMTKEDAIEEYEEEMLRKQIKENL